jgi:hypothetical protein
MQHQQHQQSTSMECENTGSCTKSEVSKSKASVNTVEFHKAQSQQRTQKKATMQKFAEQNQKLFGKAPDWPEQQLVQSLTFGNNRSSSSIITSELGDTMYVSEQMGKASKNPDIVWNLSGAETVATDGYRNRGLHAEMQTIFQLLEEWKKSPKEWEQFGITTAEDFLKGRIGGGKAVAKGKGCCRLCAAVLLKLGVNVGYIQKSKFESIWVDPFEEAGLKNPWF